MNFELLVDDRERYVSKHLMKRGRVLRLTVGDFAILGHDEQIGATKIHAVFERKTWRDLAQSIKDGRIDNNQKMLETRAKTGCKVFYIMEGAAHPKEEKSIQGIPVKNMLKKIEHMTIRDDIFVIYTRDTEHTAQKLLSYVQSYEKLETERMREEHKRNLGISGGNGGGNGGGNNTEINAEGEGDGGAEILLEEAPREVVEKLLTAARPVDISKVHLKMWQALPGIGVEWSLIFTKQFHISALILGTASVAELADIRTVEGRSFGEKKAKKILAYIKGPGVEKELLALVPRIGPKIAEQILESTTLSDIASGTFGVEDLEIIEVNGKRLGAPTARRLINIFATDL